MKYIYLPYKIIYLLFYTTYNIFPYPKCPPKCTKLNAKNHEMNAPAFSKIHEVYPTKMCIVLGNLHSWNLTYLQLAR